MRNFWFVSFSMVIWLIGPSAMSQKIVFDKVSISEDNSTAKISGITQDPNGYMWFSSNGISKFNGYEAIHFVNDPLNVNSIASNQVNCIYADEKGIIWIGTNGKGLDRFDPSPGVFTHYKHQLKNTFSLCQDTIIAIAKDKDGFMWIGTQFGLDKLDVGTGKFEHFLYDKNDTNSLSNDHITEIFADHKGTVWIGTDGGGLNKFDKSTRNFIRYEQTGNNGLLDNRIHALFEDGKGNFWIGTSHNMLFSLDREKGKFEYYPINAKPPAISAPPEKKSNANTDDFITFITEDVAKAIWMGTTRSGINRYDPVTHTTAQFNSDNGNLFTDNSGLCGYSSTDGLFWISTVEGGLYKIDPILNTIPHYSANSPVFSIYEDPNNVLWVGTSNGLTRNDRTDGNTQVFSHDTFNPTSISNNIVFSIYEDKQNKLWVGTDGGGLNLYDKPTHTFSNYRHDPKNKQSLVNDVVYATLEDGDRNMWIGTGNGLDLMDKTTGKFTHYLHDSKDTNTIGNNFIETIIKDYKNDIWVGSGYRGGMSKLLRSSNKFTHFLRGRSIFSLFSDSDNTIWAGTDSGLYYKKPSFSSFARFIDSNLNITSAAVICIVEDPQKKLWLNSTLGIIELNNDRKIIGLYSKRYGLGSTNYVLRAGYASQKGELFFSGNDGYYSFDQNFLRPNLKIPHLMITDFRLMDQPVKPGNGGPLKQEINDTKEIQLNYKQNVFSFDFAALDYANPENNQHFFMLENYDNGWHKSGTDRKAYYFNVVPGHYVFHVKGFNANGYGTEKKIHIIISPPWWQTWWFRLLIVIAIISILYTFFKIRIRSVRRQEAERSAVQLQLAALETKALRSQMNPHFVFNALNAIKKFLLKNDTANADKYLSSFAKLQRLVLDNTRESKVILENELKLLDLYLQLEHLRFEDKLTYSIHVDEKINPKETDIPSMLIQPFVENAIVHGLQHKVGKGEIKVSFCQKDGWVEAVIEDNGIGREQAASFHKNEIPHKSLATTISRERLLTLRKNINIPAGISIIDLYNEQKKACGTRVIICIPLE
jgi:ligand-binding sensor domain-containing protein